MPNNNQITINLTDTIPPENQATIDLNGITGNTYNKTQLDSKLGDAKSGVTGVAKEENVPEGLNPYESYKVVEPISTASTWYTLADAATKLLFPITAPQLADNYVYFNVVNGVVTLDSKPNKQPIENITNITNENTYNLDPSQIVPSEALYNDQLETLAGDIIKRVDQYTGEDVNYRETTVWSDGTVMTDLKVDGVIFIKINNKYYKRVLEEFIDVAWFGAKGDGVNDDSSAIQNCIDLCSKLKKTVLINKTKQFYLLGCNQLFGDESTAMAPTVKVALEMKSDLKIYSKGAILKIKDNISSVLSPTPMRMFFSNNFLEKIYFDGLVLDMNGQNNLISPNLPTSSNNFTQSQIIFSGTKSGVGAGANNVIIENCEFINNAGVSCICCSQSNLENINIGKGWIIRNNLFFNNGLNSSDHSSIFAWANDVECYGNVFDADEMYNHNTKTGALVAFEVHGSNQNFYNNKIRNYYQGLWVSVNYSQSKIEKITIKNNNAVLSGLFVDFYNANLEVAPFYDVEIIDVDINTNTVTITNDAIADDLKQFVRIGSKKHPKNVTVSNNMMVGLSTGKNTTFATFVTFPDQVSSSENMIIKNNVCSGIGDGLIVFFGGDSNIPKITLLNNDFGIYKPLTDALNNDVFGYGSGNGKVLNLLVSNINSIISDNDNRFVAFGQFSAKPKLTLNGIALGDGYVNYKTINNDNVFSVDAFLAIGGATSFDGTPILFRFNGITAIQQSIGSACFKCDGVDYFATCLINNTGSWATLLINPTTIVKQSVPAIFKSGDNINIEFKMIHNGITF